MKIDPFAAKISQYKRTLFSRKNWKCPFFYAGTASVGATNHIVQKEKFKKY
ncbi:MAG: hypothetical protein IJD87_04715 [Turicibacter sp.]|nr:hypothetical protein [Turicibacter sp.]